MRTKHLIAGLAMLSLVSGCSSESGRAFSSADAAQIRSGVTDKAAVERTLGQPYRRQIAADGSETWLYYYNHLSSSLGPTAFVPLVGPFLPNSAKASSETQQLTVKFRGETVVECKLRISSSASSKPAGTSGGVVVVAEAAAGGGAGEIRETNCGDGPGKQ
jgi:outer membrane protein assembly factor BamE (lipoprotein component of BamABCDE complex)